MKERKPGYALLLPWSPDQGGGVTHVVIALLNECAAEGAYRPVLLELNWAARHPATDEWRGIPRVRMRLRPPLVSGQFLATLAFLIFFPAELYQLRRLIRSHDLRVVNMHFPGLQSLTYVVLRRLGLFDGRFILTFHGSDARRILKTRGAERRLWSAILRNTDLLVFVSEDLRQEFLEFDAALESRSSVIHNGVNFSDFAYPVRDGFELPARFRNAQQILLSVGQFEYRKGHDLLVAAFEIVLRQCPHTLLAIAGRSGPTLENIRRLIKHRGLDEHVVLLTDLPHSQVPALMHHADILVLSSRWRKGEFGEGFPLVLGEAGAAGRPIVSTEATGCGEIITDGVTGRLVPLEDPDALAAAIVSMLNDSESAQMMGRNLKNLVRQKFSWRQAWNKYRERT